MTTNISLARLASAAYYLHRFREVHGWLEPITALALMELLWKQEEWGLDGNIAEIGIHHGLSFLALAAGAGDNDTLLAIDLFDEQGQNRDGSGLGNEVVFRSNMRRFFPQAKLHAIHGSSEKLRGKEAEFGLSGLRLLSIDGGHTRELTINDLEIATVALEPHGVTVLDDVFNAIWPGVISGLADFLRADHDLVPFAQFPNKVFLCRREYVDRYRSFFRSAFFFALDYPETLLFGHVVDLYVSRADPLMETVINRWGDTRDAIARLEAECDAQRVEHATEREAGQTERTTEQAALLAQIEAERQNSATIAAASEAKETELRSEIVRLTELEERHRQEVDQSRRAANDSEASLHRALTSKSWRWTAPLRRVIQAIRRD